MEGGVLIFQSNNRLVYMLIKSMRAVGCKKQFVLYDQG